MAIAVELLKRSAESFMAAAAAVAAELEAHGLPPGEADDLSRRIMDRIGGTGVFFGFRDEFKVPDA